MNKRDIFVQNELVKAAHPECKTLDEAKRKDVEINGCIIHYFNPIPGSEELERSGIVRGIKKSDNFMDSEVHFSDVEYGGDTYYRLGNVAIIGQPPTLARVLKAIFKKLMENPTHVDTNCNYVQLTYCIGDNERTGEVYSFIWDLLKEDGTDATYFDQTEETKEEIAKLLGWDNE